jgi:hypothetical protein
MKSIKKFPDERNFAQLERPDCNDPLPVSALFSACLSLIRSDLSLYFCNQHAKALCWVSRARQCCLLALRRFLPFFITGGGAAADSDFVFHVSKLAWATTDDTLREVRLTFFFWRCLRYAFLIMNSSDFLCDVTVCCQ